MDKHNQGNIATGGSMKNSKRPAQGRADGRPAFANFENPVTSTYQPMIIPDPVVLRSEFEEYEHSLKRTQRRLNLLCSWLRLKFRGDMSFPRSLCHDWRPESRTKMKAKRTRQPKAWSDDDVVILTPKSASNKLKSRERSEDYVEVLTQTSVSNNLTSHEQDPPAVVFPDDLHMQVLGCYQEKFGLMQAQDLPAPRQSSLFTIPESTVPGHIQLADPKTWQASAVQKRHLKPKTTSVKKRQKMDDGPSKIKIICNPSEVPIYESRVKATTRVVRNIPLTNNELHGTEGQNQTPDKKLPKIVEVLPRLESRKIMLVPVDQMKILEKVTANTSCTTSIQSVANLPTRCPPVTVIDSEDLTPPSGDEQFPEHASEDCANIYDKYRVRTAPIYETTMPCPKCTVDVKVNSLDHHLRLFCKGPTTVSNSPAPMHFASDNEEEESKESEKDPLWIPENASDAGINPVHEIKPDFSNTTPMPPSTLILSDPVSLSQPLLPSADQMQEKLEMKTVQATPGTGKPTISTVRRFKCPCCYSRFPQTTVLQTHIKTAHLKYYERHCGTENNNV